MLDSLLVALYIQFKWNKVYMVKAKKGKNFKMATICSSAYFLLKPVTHILSFMKIFPPLFNVGNS